MTDLNFFLPSTDFEAVSLIVGILSIVLALYSIYFSKKESRKSKENYDLTKDLLCKIEDLMKDNHIKTEKLFDEIKHSEDQIKQNVFSIEKIVDTIVTKQLDIISATNQNNHSGPERQDFIKESDEKDQQIGYAIEKSKNAICNAGKARRKKVKPRQIEGSHLYYQEI